MRNTTFRTYQGNRSEAGDYRKVHDFLVKIGSEDYTYGRFDWMMTNWEYFEDQYLNRIGIWEEKDQMVALTIFDHSLDVIFLLVERDYEFLYDEMISYAKENMVKEKDPEFLIYANDTNKILVKTLKKHGFIPTQEKEMVAEYDLTDAIKESRLAEGFQFVSLNEEEEYEKYLLCLYKGFGHEEQGEIFTYDQEKEGIMKQTYQNRLHLNKELKISIKDQHGNYVAHCGMWYDINSQLALIEPVCVVPKLRRLGLGREVVLEGLRRVKKMGAKKAVVGSSQQFYYALGMVPSLTGTVWKPVE